MQTTSFLLQGTSAIPNSEEIAAELMNNDDEDDDGDGNDGDGNDASKAPTPIKKEVVSLVSSHSEESTANAASNSSKTEANNSLSSPLHAKAVEVSLTNPRGKFNMTFHADGIHASTVKNPVSLVIPSGAVDHVIVFPKPTDCQRFSSSKKDTPTSPMVLVCFKDSDDEEEDDAKENSTQVTFKGKPLTQICFALPTVLEEEALKDACETASIASTDKTSADVWLQLLCHSLHIPKDRLYRVHNPADQSSKASGWTFKSHQEANKSTTSDGMPFVKCYYGVQDGCLYPMEQGLLFFKYVLSLVELHTVFFLPFNSLIDFSIPPTSGVLQKYTHQQMYG